MPPLKLPRRDAQLVQIVDAAFADAARRSGKWLLCGPGCTQCCFGVFPINQLDAARLKAGMTKLQAHEPALAAAIRLRARQSMARLRDDFPGDPETGILHETPEADRRFSEFANDEPCPALDPNSGKCDLYASRPMTCRVFGPPVRSEHGLGVCELCYHGATDQEIVACEMVPDPADLESKLLEQLEAASNRHGQTIVAHCLASE
jgi:Fe-S-cluster containining protein